MKSIEARFPAGQVMLDGNLTLPAAASGVVLFAHGSGSSRFSARNNFVARVLNSAGLGTLLFDLLTKEEEAIGLRMARLRFDISLSRSGCWRQPTGCWRKMKCAVSCWATSARARGELLRWWQR